MKVPFNEVDERFVKELANDCADLIDRQVELPDKDFEKVTADIKKALTEIFLTTCLD